MDYFLNFLNVLLYVIGVFLLLNCCYLLFFSIAGHLKIKPLQNQVKKYRKFCILIPAYREDLVILESSSAAIKHSYQGDYDVYVIADGLQPKTVATLRGNSVNVIEVQFERSTKGKALLTAMNVLADEQYDVAVVLDVDNIMGDNFLNEVNRAFDAGFKVVQAHRTAKNSNTSFSFLDACNEEINNHIYRKGHFAVGLSSALIGSGMAFNFTYLKGLLTEIGETVGEDKELDFRIAKDKVKICYLEKVYVYDEKIENAAVFTSQRTRWISAQIEFLKKYSGEGFIQLFKFGNFEFFNKVLQAYLVPRMLLIGILGIFFLGSLFISVGPSSAFWMILLVMLFASLFVALPRRFYKDKKLWQAVARIPYAIFCMFLALFRINKTKASFIPTPHKTNISNSEINI